MSTTNYNNKIFINYYKIFTNSSNAARSFFTIISDLIKMNTAADIIDSDIVKNAKFDLSYMEYALRKLYSDTHYKTNKKYTNISYSTKDGYNIKYLWGYDVTSSKPGDIIITNISLKTVSGNTDKYRIDISFEFCTNNSNDNTTKTASSIFNNILLKEIVKTFNANKPFSENSVKYNTYLINKKFNLNDIDIGNKSINNSSDNIFKVII